MHEGGIGKKVKIDSRHSQSTGQHFSLWKTGKHPRCTFDLYLRSISQLSLRQWGLSAMAVVLSKSLWHKHSWQGFDAGVNFSPSRYSLPTWHVANDSFSSSSINRQSANKSMKNCRSTYRKRLTSSSTRSNRRRCWGSPELSSLTRRNRC